MLHLREMVQSGVLKSLRFLKIDDGSEEADTVRALLRAAACLTAP